MRSSVRADRLVLALTLAVTLVGAVGHFRLPLDLGNAAMKARGTPAAEAALVRDATFGETSPLLAMLERRGAKVSAAPDAPEVADWLATLEGLPGVRRSELLPVSGPAATLVLLEVDEGVGHEPLVAALRAGAPPTHRLAISGEPAGEAAIARALAREEARIVPLVLGTFALLFLLVYRRSSLVVATLLSGVCAILWLGGIRHLLGLAIDPISSLLAPVVLTVGVAAGVHLIERHLALVAAGVELRRAPGTAARELARPLALAALTTVAGFLALAPSSIPAVRGFGLLAALGVLLALGCSVLVVPAWLRLTARADRHARVATPAAARLDRARAQVRALRDASPWIVAAAAVLGLGLGRAGLGVRVDTDPGRILPPHDRFRRDTGRIAERLGGIDTFELLLPPQGAPPGLAATAALAEEIGAEPLVRSLAGTPRRAADGTLLASILLRPSGSSEREALFARVEESAARHGYAGARATGGAVQVAQDSGALVRDLRAGLGWILLVLWVLLSLGLRSLRLGLLGLVPNVVPCAVLYGTLALLDRPLSVATAMIATVLLGLVVDDTIHLLERWASERRAGATRGEALARALAASGRAVVVTSAVLASGFGAGMAGELVTTLEFSALCAATILFALACNAVLLPALLLLPEALGARRRVRATTLSEEPACVESTTSSS